MAGSSTNIALIILKKIIWALLFLFSLLATLITLAIAIPLTIQYFELPSQKEIWNHKTLGESFSGIAIREDLKNVAYPKNLSDYSHLFRCGLCKNRGKDQDVDCNHRYSMLMARNLTLGIRANLNRHWRNFKLAFVAYFKYDTETNERIYYASQNIEHWCKTKIDKNCSKMNEEETLKLISWFYLGNSGLKPERVKWFQGRIYRGCFLPKKK